MTLGRAVITVFYGLLLAAAVSPPVLNRLGAVQISQTLYAGFSGVCHQMPERSPTLFGFQVAVCFRCLGVYAGMLAGSLLHPFLGPRLRRPGLLVAAAAPLALDVAIFSAGLWEGDNQVRLLTGVVFGVAVPSYVIPSLNAVWADLKPYIPAGG